MWNTIYEDFAPINVIRRSYVSKQMFDKNGKIRTDIFLEDNLHMNAKGYEVWTGIIKPILIECL